MSDYVAEAGHWYDHEGKPAYTQVVKTGKRKGEDRSTTLRDARKLGLVPSVTTINGILDKPALTHWLIKEATAKALAKERGEEYFEDNSAEVGSAIHAAIEEWVVHRSIEKEYIDYAEIVQSVLISLRSANPVVERSFTSPLGYGGAVDFHDKEANIIIDFKTKKLSEEDVLKGKKLHYDEHAMQLAAYRKGLDMPTAKCYNLFLSRTDPKVFVLHEWEEEEIQRGEEMFLASFYLWKKMKRFDPSFSLEDI